MPGGDTTPFGVLVADRRGSGSPLTCSGDRVLLVYRDTRRRALQSNPPTRAIPPSHQLEPGEIVTEAPEDFDHDL